MVSGIDIATELELWIKLLPMPANLDAGRTVAVRRGESLMRGTKVA